MISRAHKVLFILLLVACVAMAAVLIRLRNRAEDRLQQQAQSAPAEITEGAANEARPVTLYVPNDLDDALTTVERSVALPADENAQARVLLGALFEAFHEPGSAHPVSVVAGVDEVYLMPVPRAQGEAQSDGELAVVDLSGALASAQPSGIEPETLTLLSIMATLHANLPRVAQVHFLVDGQPRATLAGHADLTRTYLASEAIPQPAGGGR